MLRLLSSSIPLARVGLPFGLLALVLATIPVGPGGRAESAPPGPLPDELRYVPADAAVFVHADAAKLWNGPFGKSLRGGENAKLFGELESNLKKRFGSTPDVLRSVTVFWPRMKQPQDSQNVGIVLAFNAPYDEAKLKAGLREEMFGSAKVHFHSPSDRVLICLADGLDKEFASPRKEGQTGPLTELIREAGTGRHLLVAGSSLANLPDVIRGDDLPESAKAFRPIYHAESIGGIVSLDKDLSVEVRVKSATPAKAVEAEKALGLFATLVQEGLTRLPRELGRDAEKDPALKDLFTLLNAAKAGVKGAKFTTTGTETRVVAKVPADLPYAAALTAATAKAREGAARAQSSNNLKQIGLAMHSYNDAYNSFPPAAVVDKKGKPMLSWRVLILPYIEQDQLFKLFKLDEPWDGPNNIKLLDKMPRIYALPTPTKAKANETHYRVFVGNGAMFDYLQGPKIADITDGTSNTILVATAADPVPWTKPDELAFDPDKDMKQLLGFLSNDVCMTAFADGSVRALSKKISKATLNGTITRSGGEVLGSDF